ncbi:MAG: PQQ-binding-like beta-propeller repeat protein [Pirellulales bacterium]|nr:PQQ-binding-like beta-propeller repeat protein [Pirellulales bacterium]
MLLGGGTLLVLLILAPVLIWAVTRQSGDDALQQADAEYRAGSYTQAIHKYNLYLKKFPKHNGVTSARVNRGLAQLRQATPRGTRDWPAALLIAKKVISEIAPEPQFNTAHGDLAVILLAIAEGLSAQAKENPEPGVVEQTEETLALMEKYVPRSLQRGDRIAEIRALLGLAEREIDCERELQERTAAMREAVGQGDLRHAYEIRKALLKRYPRLVDNEQLEQAVLEVSQAQQAAVNLISQKQLPETTDELLPTVTLGQSNPTAEVPGAEGQVAFAAAAGAVYGIEATTGKVLWRRFVGFDGNGRCPSFPPTPISPETGADALLVNSTSRELQRVDATTGDLRWRISIGEDFEAHPVIAGNRILVATRSGRIVTIDAASGGSSAYIQVPQSLQVAPAVDLTRSLLFQLADHSNLFVLGLDDGQCKSVVHLGHELGSITSPPVVVSRFLLVTVNDRSKDSQLLVFTIDETADGPALQPVQQLRLNGHVDTPPKLAGRQVLIVTDLGAVYVLEVGGPEAKQPLREAVEPTPASGQRLIRYPLIQGNRAWVADVELTRYDIQANVSRLSPQGISDENSVFLQPPVAAGEAIVHVRRKVGMPGVIVSAVEKHEPNVYWETYLAVPLVAGPEVDPGDGAITAVTSRGAQFRMDAAKLRERTVASVPMVAVEAAQLHGPIVSLARLGNGLLVLCGGNGSQEIAVCDPRQQPMRFQWRPLPDPLACSPVAFADGLLAPSKTGVFFLDPLTGNKTEPFPPQLEPGGQLAWQTPTLFGENQAILADGQNRLYRLGVNDKPRPHLAAIDQMTMPQPIVSPVAVLGEVAYAVDAGKTLQVLKLPKLTRLEDRQRLLGGPCVWGPRRVGESVMLSTDDQLLCLDAMGHLVWQVELPYGPLAGAPLAAGDHYVMAAAGGVIWRVEAVTGRELSQVDSGRPLATGPVLLGSRLLLGGHDGSLYLVEPPPAR